jgi:hypothetical protein
MRRLVEIGDLPIAQNPKDQLDVDPKDQLDVVLVETPGRT